MKILEKKTSVFSNSLIWFGAAISIAEIMTGTFLAPLGMAKGIAAVLLGHLIGCTLLYLAGLIGARTELSAMDTVKISFGRHGSYFFSGMNIIQLVGWTAIMIASGAAAANFIFDLGGIWVWCVIICVLILVWIVAGLKNINKLNIAAMTALFVLTVVLSVIVFSKNSLGAGWSTSLVVSDTMRFGTAVELSVAMPLSWLPLISDYTRHAAKKKKATLASAAVYFLASSWMYIIGLAAALYTGESDIAKIMSGARLGIAGIIIIIFSTVTTTFLDVFSAGASAESISNKAKEKPVSIAVCVLGTVFAVFANVSQFEPFLYVIGSVFAPMISILITDVFILKNDRSSSSYNIKNLVLWLIGFVIYRIFMQTDTPVGSTLPVMIIISALCVAADKIGGKISDGKNS